MNFESIVAIYIIALIIGCIIAIAIRYYFVENSYYRNDNPPREDPPRRNNISHNYKPRNSETPRMRFGDENLYPDEWRDINRLSERERDRLLQGKVQRFWDNALTYSIRYIEDGDIESLSEFLSNIWSTRDLVESAEDLHTLTENVIERLYFWRDTPEYRELIYTLLKLVLSNADNYIKTTTYRVWRTPSKLAIMLEKDKRIDEAIEVCDFCIARDIPDRGYYSFKERKERLLKKKGKT